MDAMAATTPFSRYDTPIRAQIYRLFRDDKRSICMEDVKAALRSPTANAARWHLAKMVELGLLVRPARGVYELPSWATPIPTPMLPKGKIATPPPIPVAAPRPDSPGPAFADAREARFAIGMALTLEGISLYALRKMLHIGPDQPLYGTRRLQGELDRMVKEGVITYECTRGTGSRFMYSYKLVPDPASTAAPTQPTHEQLTIPFDVPPAAPVDPMLAARAIAAAVALVDSLAAEVAAATAAHARAVEDLAALMPGVVAALVSMVPAGGSA